MPNQDDSSSDIWEDTPDSFEDADTHIGRQLDIISEVPHVYATHHQAGYREGISVSKTAHLQAGFDEGYLLGAEFGYAIGWLTAAAEALETARRPDSAALGGLQRVGEGLTLRSVYGSEYFDAEGKWLYPVAIKEGKQPSLQDVVLAHPVIGRYVALLKNESKRSGVILKWWYERPRIKLSEEIPIEKKE
jgi:Essential protein Yae1, N terminal